MIQREKPNAENESTFIDWEYLQPRYHIYDPKLSHELNQYLYESDIERIKEEIKRIEKLETEREQMALWFST
jgi:hypothetical protein